MSAYKGLHLGGRGRQAGQVEAGPAQERGFVGFLAGLQPFGFETCQDKIVNGVPDPGLFFHLGYRGTFGGDEGPLRFPFGALVDPLLDERNLLLGEGLAGIDRWHAEGHVFGTDLLVDLALRRVPRDDDFVTAAVDEQSLGLVQAHLGHAHLLVRAMALEAVVGEDGTDFPVEVHGLGGRLGRGCGWHRCENPG